VSSIPVLYPDLWLISELMKIGNSMKFTQVREKPTFNRSI
jgi:hypothetical protein